MKMIYWLILALLTLAPAQAAFAQASPAEGEDTVRTASVERPSNTGAGRQPASTTLSASAQTTPTTPIPTIRSPISAFTLTRPITIPQAVTTPVTSTVTSTVAPTVTQVITSAISDPITTTAPAGDATESTPGPLQGTIIANRTEASLRFFVEGATYEVGSLRSQGLALPRETAVLNLYNCDAQIPETQEGCFWDPYLLNRDGLYEIVAGEVAGETASLVLQEAGAPPVNQIWVQNRTTADEVIFYNDQQFDLPASALQEFSGQPDVPVTLYLRSCLELTDRTVCEWRPQSVETGVYYALAEVSTAGTVPGSRIQMIELQPIMASTPEGPTVETPVQLTCTVAVPRLNVRNGPGLEYAIITQVRGTEAEPGTVLVVGRDETNQWLAVDERVAPEGWIAGSAGFVTCQGDINSLPVAEVVNAPIATPTPQVATAPAGDQPAANNEDVAAEPVVEAAPEPAAPLTTTIPDGQALLIINNGFDQVVRFTLDQVHRVEQGPSEYDLQPGQSMSLLVWPGQIAFSASTPWRGLSGNDDFFIDSRQSRTLWLIFAPDPDGSGGWLLQY